MIYKSTYLKYRSTMTGDSSGVEFTRRNQKPLFAWMKRAAVGLTLARREPVRFREPTLCMSTWHGVDEMWGKRQAEHAVRVNIADVNYQVWREITYCSIALYIVTTMIHRRACDGWSRWRGAMTSAIISTSVGRRAVCAAQRCQTHGLLPSHPRLRLPGRLNSFRGRHVLHWFAIYWSPIIDTS